MRDERKGGKERREEERRKERGRCDLIRVDRKKISTKAPNKEVHFWLKSCLLLHLMFSLFLCFYYMFCKYEKKFFFSLLWY